MSGNRTIMRTLRIPTAYWMPPNVARAVGMPRPRRWSGPACSTGPTAQCCLRGSRWWRRCWPTRSIRKCGQPPAGRRPQRLGLREVAQVDGVAGHALDYDDGPGSIAPLLEMTRIEMSAAGSAVGIPQ